MHASSPWRVAVSRRAWTTKVVGGEVVFLIHSHFPQLKLWAHNHSITNYVKCGPGP